MSSLSVRTRFEVFKRDRFTCSYCGKTPPDVLLECDHIIPRAAGGSNEITNLTTACVDCNRGKSAGLLEEGTAPTVSRAVVDDLRERLEQATAYAELVGQQDALLDKQVSLINDLWAKAFNAATEKRKGGEVWVLPYGRWPDERSVRLFLRRIPIHEIVAAIDITASRFREPTEDVCRFFYKVCWRRIKNESGPIDGPGPIREAEEETPWREWYMTTREQLEDANTELGATRHRVADLEAEVADLRAIVGSYQDETRTRRVTRIGEGG